MDDIQMSQGHSQDSTLKDTICISSDIQDETASLK